MRIKKRPRAEGFGMGIDPETLHLQDEQKTTIDTCQMLTFLKYIFTYKRTCICCSMIVNKASLEI